MYVYDFTYVYVFIHMFLVKSECLLESG